MRCWQAEARGTPSRPLGVGVLVRSESPHLRHETRYILAGGSHEEAISTAEGPIVNLVVEGERCDHGAFSRNDLMTTNVLRGAVSPRARRRGVRASLDGC